MATKERIDVLLVHRGFFDSREKAKRAIMAGLVFSNTERLEKPGTKIDYDAPLAVKGSPLKYVSRGGLKLEKAIEAFQLDFQDKSVLDIGASTGGFTDCALQHGAKIVYALDVGYGQLDWKLRSDERVVVMERTNFRYVKGEDLSAGLPQMATIDVSFISLGLILPVLYPLLLPNSDVVALVKPQFEAGREQVGKKGVVRDPNVHKEVLKKTVSMALALGYHVKGLSFSPITGGEGNIEFLLILSKTIQDDTSVNHQKDEKRDVQALNNQVMNDSLLTYIQQTVEQAHDQFKG
jgi:23S rRNA (cytidine1920-2'-O)/16S rRNA (cytidine1409-2'-O)-methyltransferase